MSRTKRRKPWHDWHLKVPDRWSKNKRDNWNCRPGCLMCEKSHAQRKARQVKVRQAGKIAAHDPDA